ncbi:MAG: S41 family peptidase [Chloroflexota bacterium]|nr:S41 family peptidase [Chloroflexota bacterium]
MSQAPEPTQPPTQYLTGALDWVGGHAIKTGEVDWPSIRARTLAMAPAPSSSTDTYPALRFAVQQLGDGNAFILPPGAMDSQVGPGLSAMYPDGLVTYVDAEGEAAKLGVHTGDVITTSNGKPLTSLNSGVPVGYEGRWGADFGKGPTYTMLLKKAGVGKPVEVTIPGKAYTQQVRPTGRMLDLGSAGAGLGIGYINLPIDGGSASYPADNQKIMQNIDAGSKPVCGWIIDLRQNGGGDIWSMLAATGPILGEGEVGGFLYKDGKRDTWSYRGGKVLWNGQERDESKLDGSPFQPKVPGAPVALLMSRVTEAAGELVIVAFKGRPATRTFGEPTGGGPAFVDHTQLSDDTFLSVSGAYATDRSGHVYKGRIAPDQPVTLDWTLLGQDNDPVIVAAKQWLATQTGCKQ